jgi:hypothetical protein
MTGVRATNLAVVLPDYVKDNVFISRIPVVVMFEPPRRLNVYLHTPDPVNVSDPHPRIRKVRTSVMVGRTGLKNLDWLTLGSTKVPPVKILHLPEEVKK